MRVQRHIPEGSKETDLECRTVAFSSAAVSKSDVDLESVSLHEVAERVDEVVICLSFE